MLKKEFTFHIIATGFNCHQYVDKCVQSVFNQTESNWCLHLVNDGSTDATGERCLNYKGHNKVVVHNYKENLAAAFRRMQVIRTLPAEDVVLLLGLDDELLPNCLARVQQEYDKGMLMTYGNWKDQYGQMLPANFSLDFDEATHQSRNYRIVKYRSTAPNTFKVFLFNRIPDEDFQLDGKWIDTTTESETMFSCLEMSGKERIGVIKDVIYLYNRALPNGTLKRLGVDYKLQVLDRIMKRPKKELYVEEETVTALVTVALPVYNSPFAWFAMESLCRQKTSVQWELVVYEDAEGANGKQFYLNYFSRMQNCIRIVYVYTKERRSLAEKWCVCAEHSDQNSMCFLLQAGDDYSPPNRIEDTFQKFKSGVDWYEQNNGFFLNLRTRQLMSYSKGSTAATGVLIAISTSLMKAIQAEAIWSGVDFWLWNNCKKLKINLNKHNDTSHSFNYGVFTDGAEHISKSRKHYYDRPVTPFARTNRRLEQILPKEIIAQFLRIDKNKMLTFANVQVETVVKNTTPKGLSVLNILTADWANYAQDNCAALNAAGVKCIGMKLVTHSFGYDKQLPVVTRDQMLKEVNSGRHNIIQIFNSDATMIALVKDFKGKVVVYHTGSNFRMKHKVLNHLFNPIVTKSIIALGEFATLGAKNSEYISVAVNVRPERIVKKQSLKFLHCPSNADVKGTSTIVRLMKNIPCDFTSDTKILQYQDNLERMKSCDVYIELLNPQINGDKYGSFGTTAVEAAMLGKIVVTQNLSSDVYAATYGQSPLVLVKDEQGFVEKINWLLSLTPEEIFELKKEHQKWSITKHSYLATGKRLKKILDEI